MLRITSKRMVAYQSGTCTTLDSVQLDLIFESAILLDVTFCGGGIRTTLHSNDRAVRTTITAYQCGTCTTLESVLSDKHSEVTILLDVTLCGGGGVVYVPFCIQMIEQSEL